MKNSVEEIINNKKIDVIFYEILNNKVKENFITFSEILLNSLRDVIYLKDFDLDNIEKVEILMGNDLFYFGCFHINIFNSLKNYDSKNIKIVVPFNKNYIINTNNIIFYIMGCSGNIISKICKYSDVEIVSC